MEKSSGAYTMNRLAKQSQKNFKLFAGLNKQEERRLEILNDYLKKNYYYEDTLWVRDFIDTHRALEEIKVSTDNYRGHESFNDMPSSDQPTSARSTLPPPTVKRSLTLNVATGKQPASKLARTRSQLSASLKSQQSINSASPRVTLPFTPEASSMRTDTKSSKKIYSKSATFSRSAKESEELSRNAVSAAGYQSMLKTEDKRAKPRRPFCISMVDDLSTRLSADFFHKNQQEKATSADQETDAGSKIESTKNFEDETYLMVNTSNFDSLMSKSFKPNQQAAPPSASKLSALLPGHFSGPTMNESSVCSSFPCSLLKSYTSIVGRKNDRNEKQMQSVGLKSIVNANLYRTKSLLSSTAGFTPSTAGSTSMTKSSALSNIYTSSDKSDMKPQSNAIENSGDVGQNQGEDEWNKYGTNNENQASIARKMYIDFVENKSIRRPLRRSGSSKDFFKRLQSLESKVKYCHEQNAINLKSEDRNIRYGDPLPKKKIYRQLRIISQFESFIF